MGNQCGGCRSRKKPVNVFDPDDVNNEFVEQPVVRQQSNEEDRDEQTEEESGESGSSSGDDENNEEEDRIRQEQDQLFEEFCEKWLDLNNPEEHIKEVEDEEEPGQKMLVISDFAYFQQVFKTAFFWKKMRFERPKSIYEKVRREYLKRGDMPMYKQTLREAQELEEGCFENVLQQLYEKMKIDSKVFQDSIDFYSRDEAQEEELGQIVKLTQESMQVLKRQFFANQEQSPQIELSREQALQVLKTKLEITLKLLMEFREVEQDLKETIFAGVEEDDPSFDEKQLRFKEKLNEAIKFMNFMVSDHLHNATHVDIEEFNNNLKRLNLNETTDPEYAQLMAAYQLKVDQVNQVDEDEKNEEPVEEQEEDAKNEESDEPVIEDVQNKEDRS